jgi:hypothetical protein
LCVLCATELMVDGDHSMDKHRFWGGSYERTPSEVRSQSRRNPQCR